MLFSGLWEEPEDCAEEPWVLCWVVGVEGGVAGVVAWLEGAGAVAAELGVDAASGLAVVVEEPEPQAAIAIAKAALRSAARSALGSPDTAGIVALNP